MSQSTLSHARHIHHRPLKYRRPQKVEIPSRTRPLPAWVVALIALGAFWLVESLCYLIDHWRW